MICETRAAAAVAASVATDFGWDSFNASATAEDKPVQTPTPKPTIAFALNDAQQESSALYYM